MACKQRRAALCEGSACSHGDGYPYFHPGLRLSRPLRGLQTACQHCCSPKRAYRQADSFFSPPGAPFVRIKPHANEASGCRVRRRMKQRQRKNPPLHNHGATGDSPKEGFVRIRMKSGFSFLKRRARIVGESGVARPGPKGAGRVPRARFTYRVRRDLPRLAVQSERRVGTRKTSGQEAHRPLRMDIACTRPTPSAPLADAISTTDPDVGA